MAFFFRFLCRKSWEDLPKLMHRQGDAGLRIVVGTQWVKLSIRGRGSGLHTYYILLGKDDLCRELVPSRVLSSGRGKLLPQKLQLPPPPPPPPKKNFVTAPQLTNTSLGQSWWRAFTGLCAPIFELHAGGGTFSPPAKPRGPYIQRFPSKQNFLDRTLPSLFLERFYIVMLSVPIWPASYVQFTIVSSTIASGLWHVQSNE